VTIVAHLKRPGYVIITPDRIDKLPTQTPIHISQTLEKWQNENPDARTRAVCPIVDGGQTLAVHIWFDT
jgi:hypothetical protein